MKKKILILMIGFLLIGSSVFAEMFIDSNGNVGIGTTSPGYELDVVGNVEAYGFTINGIPLGTSSDSYWSAIGGDIYYNSGYVGIWTTSPGYELDVVGTINASTAIKVNGIDVLTSETDPVFGASAAAGIIDTDIINWDTAYGWGDHSTQGYLSSEDDPQVGTNTTNYLPKWDGTALVTGTIYDNGNVGIGTTGPIEKLDVEIAAGVYGDVVRWGNASGYAGRLGIGTSPSRVYMGYGENEHLVIDDVGNVGIGTADPFGDGVEIYSNSSFRYLLVHSDGGGALLGLDRAANTNSSDIRFITAGSTYWKVGMMPGTGSDDKLEFLRIGTGTVMTLTGAGTSGDGNVGIGVMNPGTKLDIQQNSAGDVLKLRVWNGDNTNAGSHSLLEIASGGASGGDAYMQFSIGGVQTWSAGADNSDADKFKISAGSGPGSSDVFTIQTNGNVGIGTTSPQAELDVAGDIALSGAGMNTANGLVKLDASADVPTGQIPTLSTSQNPTNVSGTRAIDTIYQNTSGYPLLVTISFRADVGATGGSKALADLRVDSTSPPAQVTHSGGFFAGPANTVAAASVVHIVPNNYYYRLETNTTGTGSIWGLCWWETEIRTP